MSLPTALLVGSSAAFVYYGVLCLGSASMKTEFARLGLERFRVLTGILEVTAGLGFLVGLNWPPALWVSSGGVVLLMLCVVGIRASVNDPVVDMLPALILLLANACILVASLRAA